MELNKQVVMLPTKNKALIYTDRYGNLKSHSTESTLPLDSIGSNYHLYVLSDEEIKEGDWCYDKIPDDNGNLIDTIYQKKKGPQYQNTSTERKIIATTDDSLTFIDDCYHRYFPTLPLEFIQDYIKAYNTSKPITEIMVEYEGRSGRILSYGRGVIPPDIHPKLDKDNQINIKEIKQPDVMLSLSDAIKFVDWTSDKSYKRCADGEWMQVGTGDYKIVAKNTQELYKLFKDNELDKC